MLFSTKNPQYHHLKNKWTSKHQQLQNKLWEKHGDSLKSLAVGSMGGMMLLSTPFGMLLPAAPQVASAQNLTQGFDRNVFLASQLKKVVPEDVRSLSSQEEQEISRILNESFGFKVTPEVNGIKLNRSYGLMGGEQHLYRFPGDNVYKHADTTAEWAMFGDAGIAPGLGAWGYFAPSEKDFTEKDKLREKYYIAVQTFLVPGYVENVAKYRDFFKYRKMLVVNPKTGQAVVVVIGDSGPSEYTGKHLGGSPEVMHSLGIATGPRKGAVLYFFIDEHQDQVPLGPISVREKQS